MKRLLFGLVALIVLAGAVAYVEFRQTPRCKVCGAVSVFTIDDQPVCDQMPCVNSVLRGVE